MQRFWRAQAKAAAALPFATLRDLRGQARSLRRELDQFAKASDLRLAARLTAQGPERPRGADTAWRPALWQARLDAVPSPGADGQVRFDGETALYHDCPLGEISARQIADPDPAGQTPFALATEIYGFSGSYLSISVRLPDGLTNGTGTRHILILEAAVSSEMPLDLLARLNIAQGPDVAQLVQLVTAGGAPDQRRAEFDLGQAQLSERRVSRLWVDIFFQSPALNRIVLHDLVLARRPRAEL